VSVKVSGPAVDPKSPGANFIPAAPTFPAFLTDITSAEVKGTKKILFASGPPGGLPTPAMHTIDGKKFDGEVGEVVLLNTVEEWKVMNATVAISHPFHIHINPFQVVEVFDPNATLTDPATGKPVNKYVFDKRALKVQGQCYLDPNGDPDDWKPCDPNPYLVQTNRIWWDVFPIPSAAVAKDANGNTFVNPATKQPVNVPGYFKMRSRFVDYTGYYVIHCHILAHEDRGMMTVVEVAPVRSPYSHH
jgi:FtsP/CotA-like multicopper oxidase with cupredoxin domain